MQARVAELHGADAGPTVARCPGAGECDRYDSAAGATPEEKARACRSCTRCEGRAPLTDSDTDETADTVAAIEWLADQQQAGRVFSLDELTPEEWQMLCLWRAAERQHERAYQGRMAALVGVMMQH